MSILMRILSLALAGTLAALSTVMAQQNSPADTPSETAQQDLQTERDRIAIKAAEAWASGSYENAAAHGKKMLAIEKQWLGTNHVKVHTSLDWLADVYVAAGKWDSAKDKRSELLTYIKEKFGSDDWRVTDARLALKHIDWLETHSPAERIQFAQMQRVNAIALQQYSTGNYAEALKTSERILRTYEQLVGKGHAKYAQTLGNMGAILGELSRYPDASRHYSEAIEIQQQLYGELHPQSANTFNNLGYLYQEMGRPVEAEQLYRDTLRIRKTILGEEHVDYAVSLDNLGFLYMTTGRYKKAEPLLVKALETRKQLLGVKHETYAISLNNCAMLYRRLGTPSKALSYYIQAMEITEARLGRNHPLFATSLHNVAFMHATLGNLAKAELLYRQALEIQKETPGPRHPEYLLTLHNLGDLFHATGRLDQAEQIYLRVVELRRQILGENHPEFARSVHNLAGLCGSLGKYQDELALYRQAVGIRERVLGRNHPDFTSSLASLAFASKAQQDYEKAAGAYKQVMKNTFDQVESASELRTEDQQLQFAQGLRTRLDNFITTVRHVEGHDEDAYQSALRWKGNALMRQRAIRLAAQDPEIQSRFDELRQLTHRIRQIPESAHSQEQQGERLDALNRKSEIELEIRRRSSEFRDVVDPINLQDLLDRLPAETVLIDYLVCNDFVRVIEKAENRIDYRPVLTAFVIRQGRPVRMFDLGPMDRVQKAITDWKSSFGHSRTARHAAHNLRQMLWEPMTSQLEGANTILISPDESLGRFPFAALPGSRQNSFLLEEHRIAYVPVPQLIPQFFRSPASTGPHRILCVGDVDYGTSSNDGDSWAPLPGTASELRSIADQYGQSSDDNLVTVLQGDDATKDRIVSLMPQNSIIHFATHGLFHSRTVSTKGPILEFMGEHIPKSVQVFDSGLVLAGANQSGSASIDDSLLLSDEILALPLRQTDLVVLSACETGEGKVHSGEGLLGIQRAFQVAGARTTVASLWKVDDIATQVLMTEFHQHLNGQKTSRLDALRNAQLQLLRSGRRILQEAATRSSTRGAEILRRKLSDVSTGRLPPYYWAAFTLSGDWN